MFEQDMLVTTRRFTWPSFIAAIAQSSTVTRLLVFSGRLYQDYVRCNACFHVGWLWQDNMKLQEQAKIIPITPTAANGLFPILKVLIQVHMSTGNACWVVQPMLYKPGYDGRCGHFT
jgi:hypothetical protein